MKKSFFHLIAILLIPYALTGQTLYIPSGTSGIGSSNNGNVGIGNSSPGFKLDVSGNLRTTDFINANQYISVLYGGSYVVAMNGQGDGYISGRNTSYQDKFVIAANGSSYLNGGNVGIGTTSPQSLLNINLGAGDPVTGTSALRVGGTNNYPSLELGIKGNYDGMISTYGNDLHLYAGNWRTAGATASENHNISFYTSQSGSTNWNTAKMFLRYDGNLGIGSNNPLNKIQIGPNPQGWAGNDLVISNSNASQIALAISNANDHTMLYGSGDIALRPGFGKWAVYAKADGTVGVGTNTPARTLDVAGLYSSAQLRLQRTGNSLGLADIGSDSDGLKFWVGGYDGSAELIINSSGNVGIGTPLTSNPNNYRLAVNGKIGSKEVVVEINSTTWPDYVFSPEYKLPSLLEVEKFIKANRHLPEVPSAEDVKENGLSVGEMNAILLKKVEELTLHLIEKEKQMKSLEQRIEQLENK